MAIKFTELLDKIKKSQEVFYALKTAINDESLAMMQYLAGIGICDSDKVKEEFDGHYKDEYRHALLFFKILRDLGGIYVLSPQEMMFNNDCGFIKPLDIDITPNSRDINLLLDNIKAEQCAIASYETLLKIHDFSKEHIDIIKSIIKDEEEHRDDLVKILKEKRAL